MFQLHQILPVSGLPKQWKARFSLRRFGLGGEKAGLQSVGWSRYIRALERLFVDCLPSAPPTVLPPMDGRWVGKREEAHRFQVHPARFWELVAVARFDHAIFPKANPVWETVLFLLKMKLGGGARLFIARDCEAPRRVIATVYLRKLPSAGVGFISNVAVHPDYRRQRLAGRMMRHVVLPEARSAGLRRLVLNVEADSFVRDFYHHLGFRVARRADFEIRTPKGECPMELDLG